MNMQSKASEMKKSELMNSDNLKEAGHHGLMFLKCLTRAALEFVEWALKKVS